MMKDSFREEENRPGPAYFQEMPEYVPMDAVPDDEEKPKTQEGLEFFCPACGKKIPLGVKECPECGASLGELWSEKDDNAADFGGEIGGLGGNGGSVNG